MKYILIIFILIIVIGYFWNEVKKKEIEKVRNNLEIEMKWTWELNTQ